MSGVVTGIALLVGAWMMAADRSPTRLAAAAPAGAGPPAAGQGPAGRAPADRSAVDLTGMAAAVGPESARRAIEGLATRADCTGPRGPFTTELVSADGSTRFVQVRASGRTELLLVNGQPLARGGDSAQFGEAPPAVAAFVRGHDIHRLLLELDRRFLAAGDPTEEGCVGGFGPDGPAQVCRRDGDTRPSRIDLAVATGEGIDIVAIELHEWRRVHGVWLPFEVVYVQGADRFTHRFREILPFRLAPGVALPDAPSARFDRLGDLADIAALHEAAIAADRYEDVVVPVVAVSADGTLGWLACQIEAEGRQIDPAASATPIAYGFSWVELVAKRAGRWLRIGNASSAKP